MTEKTRIEYQRLEQARWHAQDCGGRIAYQPVTKRVLWYSHHYTMTDIFTDTDGNGDWIIGGYSAFRLY